MMLREHRPDPVKNQTRNFQMHSNKILFMDRQSYLLPLTNVSLETIIVLYVFCCQINTKSQSPRRFSILLEVCSFIFQANVISIQRQRVDYFHLVCGLNIFIAAQCPQNLFP